jgi:pimeloyl-ACP methyl ester carboxylesterase
MTITLQTIDGLTIGSEVYGDSGIPVLLLHGWANQIENMQPVAAKLGPLGYHIHILDLPGFGRSTLPAETWGVPEYARFVAHYLDHANLKRVNLIGHSFGGRISLVLGADYADYVDKIVLTAGAGVLTPPSAGDQVRKVAIDAAKGVLSLPGFNAFEGRLRQWARQRFGSEDLRNAGPLEPIFRKVIAQDLVPYAARIKAPTLLIWGDQDQDTPLWQAQVLEKTIPDAGLVVFQGAGHFAYQERLPDFVRIVDTFLKGNNGA